MEGYSAASMLTKLERERRAARIRIGGEERWIAAEDAALYRDALGVPPPPGLPEALLDAKADPMVALVRRYARTHGPFTTEEPAERYGVDPVARASRARAGRRPGPRRAPARAGRSASGATRMSCAGCAARAWPICGRRPRRSRPASSPGSCPSWQNVDAFRPAGAGPDRLREALVPLQGVALTPEVWERDVLPRRLGAYSPAWLDELCTGGEVVWVGAGALGRSGGKVALYFREDVRLAGPPPSNAKIEAPKGEVHDAIRDLLGRRPCFWIDLVDELDLSPEELHNALWDLAWAGEVTNDAFAPLRARRLRSVQRAPQRGRRFAARRAGAVELRSGPLVAHRGAVRERAGLGTTLASAGRADA